MLTYSTVIFYLLFGRPMTNFGSLSRRQPHSPNVNYCIFIIFCFRGHWQPHNNQFLKTWDEFPRDPDPQGDWDIGKLMNTRKVKIYKKTILPVVNVSSPDRDYLHCWLDVEGDTLKVSLHCCQLIWDKENSNHNKNFHQHKCYMPLPSLLLTK